MKLCGKIAVIIVRTILYLICKVDKKELRKIPTTGPFIIAMNHINFLEVPLIFVDLRPRKIHGIAKKETWNNPVLGFIADCWESIPINREGFTARTFRRVKEFLKKGDFIVIAPEGTRTGDGKLRKAHPGIITMAMQADIPIIPLVHYGGESFWDNLSRLKRTKFTYKVGEPFKLLTEDKNRETRRELVDQLMYRMAALLPEKYRGYYKDISKTNNSKIIPLDEI